MSATPSLSQPQSNVRPHKALHISLWVVQVLLAAAFGMGGFMKATMPISELAEKMIWPGAVPPELLRFIGAAEFAAALGLILPAATRIRPVLTPLAASGIVVIMALAIPFHLSRSEGGAPMNLFIGGMAAFVAWGRFRKAPILPRS
jgi:putative oxidoreductase